MLKTVFICDACNREIGIKPHVSLMINNGHGGCGIAIPNKKGSGPWALERIKHNFVHFHNGKCVGAYFDKLITEATKPVK